MLIHNQLNIYGAKITDFRRFYLFKMIPDCDSNDSGSCWASSSDGSARNLSPVKSKFVFANVKQTGYNILRTFTPLYETYHIYSTKTQVLVNQK